MKYVKWKWVAKATVFGIAFVTLYTTAAMYLWNYLVVGIFALPALGFFQTLGLLILVRLFTGNLGPRGSRGGWGMRGRMMRERWKGMSENERRMFMERWSQHACGPRYQDKQNTAAATDDNNNATTQI